MATGAVLELTIDTIDTGMDLVLDIDEVRILVRVRGIVLVQTRSLT